MKLLDKLKNYFSNTQVIEAEVPIETTKVPETHVAFLLATKQNLGYPVDISRCPESFKTVKHEYAWGLGYDFSYNPTEEPSYLIKVKSPVSFYTNFSVAETFFFDMNTKRIYQFKRNKFVETDMKFVSYINKVKITDPYPIINN